MLSLVSRKTGLFSSVSISFVKQFYQSSREWKEDTCHPLNQAGKTEPTPESFLKVLMWQRKAPKPATLSLHEKTGPSQMAGSAAVFQRESPTDGAVRVSAKLADPVSVEQHIPKMGPGPLFPIT